MYIVYCTLQTSTSKGKGWDNKASMNLPDPNVIKLQGELMQISSEVFFSTLEPIKQCSAEKLQVFGTAKTGYSLMMCFLI